MGWEGGTSEEKCNPRRDVGIPPYGARIQKARDGRTDSSLRSE